MTEILDMFLHLLLIPAFALACKDAADCSFNGECIQKHCNCDAAWAGARCSTLNLRPAKRTAGLNSSNAQGPLSSWGGTVNKGDDGKWHMHVAQFVNNCGFNQWAQNSRIVHAVADAPDGQFEVVSTVWPVWSHNPAVVRAPTGEWVMTFVSNFTKAPHREAKCEDGKVVANSSIMSWDRLQNNFMSIASSPYGPWSTPVPLDQVFDTAVPPFFGRGVPNRNSNIIITIAKDGSMIGLWRRCCTPPAKYEPVGGGGASIIFGIHASKWNDVSTWEANATALFPDLRANGYEDPHIYTDTKRPGVVHAVFHNMVGGWHGPEYNNSQVGAHAYSKDGGRSWVDTGIAFNSTVTYEDGTYITFIQRERPHIVLDDAGGPSYLVSGVTYSLLPTLPTRTIIQPIGRRSSSLTIV